ncbi:MAG: rhodanese-like domain-containing protein [Pyrinomonadaceae bacterium]
MSECTVLTLKNKLENEEIFLLDVREPVEFAAGRIADAKLIPLGEVANRHSEIDESKPIYVICRSGNRSGKAQQQLRGLGYENVINVKGGFNAWQNQGFDFEQDSVAPWDLERQVRFTAGSLVLFGFLLSVLVNRYFIAISVFVGAGLVFSALTNTCGMGMLLAKMPWNRRNNTVHCEVNDNAA